MCGIAGAVDLNDTRPFSGERLATMLGAIAHRGPDDAHTYMEPGLAMGTRRLSILDLHGGRQPLSNESGEVWISFNGELFDYPELRSKLLARGHRLATHCDTEAWVHLYEDHGTEMLTHVKGQFAFALWDGKNRSLFLGRDRLGICPLYYAESGGWLYWGSEIKAILASGRVPIRPDLKGIDHVFTFFSAGTTRTCFQGIKSIPPGHFLEVSGGRVILRKYWDLDFPDAGDERRDADVGAMVEEFKHLLGQAVQRRLRSDVPVVSYISGGLDSTVILALSSQDRGRNIPSFTIGLDQAGPDERAEAAESAALLASPLTTVTMGRDQIAEAYPELIRAAEEPVLDTSCACLMRLASSVHDAGYKVALTGQGADEALAGYAWFKTESVTNTFVPPFAQFLPRLLHKAMLRRIGGGHTHRPPWLAMRGARTVQQGIAELLGQCRETLYSAEMWNRLGRHSAFDDLDLTNDRIKRWHPLNRSLYVGYKVMLPGLLLAGKGDRVAMNASVENRHPFLDEDVVSFCASLDPRLKLKGLTDKWLLREVAKQVLPQAIAKRPKTMFRATRAKTFLGANRPHWVDQLLSPESLRATGYFDLNQVQRIRQQQAGRRLPGIRQAVFDTSFAAVIATQLWHHIYCAGGLAELPAWSPPKICSLES